MSLLTLPFGTGTPNAFLSQPSQTPWYDQYDPVQLGQEAGQAVRNKISQAAKDAFAKETKGWFGARGITLLIGLLLLAAGIFTHETIINTAKTAGKAAAVAA